MIIKMIFPIILVSLNLAADPEFSPYNFGAYIELNQNIFLSPPVRPNGPPFNGVVVKYGPAIVKEGFYKAQSQSMPWSGWWYPKTNKIFFDESNGPGTSILGRYDDYVISLGKPNPMSRNYEETELYTNEAAPW